MGRKGNNINGNYHGSDLDERILDFLLEPDNPRHDISKDSATYEAYNRISRADGLIRNHGKTVAVKLHMQREQIGLGLANKDINSAIYIFGAMPGINKGTALRHQHDRLLAAIAQAKAIPDMKAVAMFESLLFKVAEQLPSEEEANSAQVILQPTIGAIPDRILAQLPEASKLEDLISRLKLPKEEYLTITRQDE